MATSVRSVAEAPVNERDARIIRAAEELILQEGEQRVQMKDVASRAGVSLATLYRAFPSKDHLLGAVALERQRRMTARVRSSDVPGATAGERAGAVVMDEFRSILRHPDIAAAFQRVTNAPNRSTSEYVTGIRIAMEEALLSAMGTDEQPVTPEQRALMPLFLYVTQGAFSGWLAGTVTVEQVHQQIRMAQRLFDLSPESIRRDLLD